MKNQEFQAVLQNLPAGFDIVVNGSHLFDVKGNFEIRDDAVKGTIHITDIFAAKSNKVHELSFVKDKELKKEKPVKADDKPQEKKKTYKTYEPGEKEKIIEDIRNGLSFKEISEKYNISLQTYNRRKKEYKAQPASGQDNKSSDKHRKVSFNPAQISEDDRIKITEDIKLGLYSRQILKKYHINIPALAVIKKSIKEENGTMATTDSEDDPEVIKKRQVYGRSINNGFDKIPALGMLKAGSSSSVIPVAPTVTVDINKTQETIAKETLNKFKPATNPNVRNWQADMIARGL
jgi:transposase